MADTFLQEINVEKTSLGVRNLNSNTAWFLIETDFVDDSIFDHLKSTSFLW
jgi:hypothetical protein